MLDIGLLSKYRSELMGIATILIIICHVPAYGVDLPEMLKRIIVHGGSACDMFLFLSGLGMYHSFDSRKIYRIGELFQWLKRRFIKIFVPYLMIAIPCLTIVAINEHLTLWQFLFRLSTLSYWVDGKGLWFLSVLLIMYLFTPLLYLLVKKRLRWILVFGALASFGIGSIMGLQGPAYYIQFGICRIPCYLIGFMVAKEILDNKAIRWCYVIIPIMCGLVTSAYLNNMTFFRVSYYWLEGLLLLSISILLLKQLSGLSKLLCVLRSLGSISLESYCTNVLFLPHFYTLSYVIILKRNANPRNGALYIGGTIICLIISVIINKLSKLVISHGGQRVE